LPAGPRGIVSLLWALVIIALAVVLPEAVRAAEDTEVDALALSKEIVALHQAGRDAETEALFRRLIALEEKLWGAEAPAIAPTVNNLALIYQRQGRPADAAPLFERVVTLDEKALGPDNPDLATVLGNLAEAYRKQGRYAEAEKPLERSLAIREKILGPDNLELAIGINNLASVYYGEGKFAEAATRFERVLTILQTKLGEDNPSVLTAAANLAQVYSKAGQYAAAEKLALQTMEVRERTLGPNHPDVATSLNNLAGLYVTEARYQEAEPLYRRALATREKTLGADDPEIATSLNNLALLYVAQGRTAEAKPLYERALAIREKALGPDHPDVASDMNNLAELYKDEGRYSEAEPLLVRALAIAEKTLGPDHPDFAGSINNLAGLYYRQGRYAEAEPLYKRSIAILERALGPDHPDLAAHLNNLAQLYRNEGRTRDAEALFQRALAILTKAKGADHPDLATPQSNLAGVYLDEERYAEAEPLYGRALEIREKALGPDHPDVAASLNNLGTLYRALRRYADAEALFRRANAILEKALGPAHPTMAIGLGNLAGLLQDEGHYDEAETLDRRALSIRETALGPDHPDVAVSVNNLAALYQVEGKVDEALAESARAVAIVERHLAADATQRSTRALAEERRNSEYFVNYIAIADTASALRSDQRPALAAETFRVVQLTQTSSAAQAVAGMSARFASGRDALAALVRKRQDLAFRWQRLDDAIVETASQPPSDRKPEQEAAMREAQTDVAHRLELLNRQIADEFPSFSELTSPSPLPAAEAQALLAPDEALLVYLAGTNKSWIWVVRQGAVGFYPLAISGQGLTEEVRALRTRLDPELNPDLYPYPADRAHALYEKLLGPAISQLAGIHRLLIVPDGALQSLPFGVLVTQAPEHRVVTPADHRDVAWLARDYAVSVLPSVSSLRALRRLSADTDAAAPFLGIGDPVLAGSPGGVRGVGKVNLFRGAMADVDKVRELPPLPETADELGAMAHIMGAASNDLLLRERASEPVLRQMATAHYRVVAFATHGLMSGDLTGLAEPALVLTPPPEATPANDGLLTASKIATLKFKAEWVVLSACNTAADDGTPDGGGLSGLAKAFFYAGARSVLVSHWAVWSKATVQLTTGAFTALMKDPLIGRAEALRRSMMAMLDPANPPEFAHPLAWAPFVLAGEGGAGR
jgi:CHAT domain-containing protein/tetratricopeptide (TPR) repeat protein